MEIDMKAVQIASIAILIVTIIIMGLNMFVIPFSDWGVRINGVIMMISLCFTVFTTVKGSVKK